MLKKRASFPEEALDGEENNLVENQADNNHAGQDRSANYPRASVSDQAVHEASSIILRAAKRILLINHPKTTPLQTKYFFDLGPRRIRRRHLPL
jgi:hypothetical protein